MDNTMTSSPFAIRVTSPNGSVPFHPLKVTGSEGVSRLFQFELELRSERKTPVRFDEMVGRPFAIRLRAEDRRQERLFHGVVNRFSEDRRDAQFVYYSAELVPLVWFYTQNCRSRIFQGVTVPEIVKKVLGDVPVKWKLGGEYPAHNYCVQYQESDFEFVSRLLEEEGIHYYFEHSEQSHTLVFSDRSSDNPACSEKGRILFSEGEGRGNSIPSRIVQWQTEQRALPMRVALSDYCFELPGQKLAATYSPAEKVKAGKRELNLRTTSSSVMDRTEFPGAFAHRYDAVGPRGSERPEQLQEIFDDSRRVAKLRAEEWGARSLRIRGKSDVLELASGRYFELGEHGEGDGEYFVTLVTHTATNPNVDGEAGGIQGYSNEFEALPRDVVYRPARLHTAPRIHGVQTATVIGPASEEVYTDKYGRVQVEFPWGDPDGKEGNSDSRSCWVRVSQSWAGKNWGSLQIPRVGQEVVISFVEGDPDCPLIVGSVYNASQMPPVSLPASRSKSGIMSRSLYGEQGNSSQILFDDAKGSEQLYMHAERDMVVGVENTHSTYAAGNHFTYVGFGPGPSGTGGSSSPPSLPSPLRPDFAPPSDESGGSGSGGGDSDGSWTGSWDTPVGPLVVKGSWVCGENTSIVIGNNNSVTVGADLSVKGPLVFGLTVGVNSTVVLGLISSVAFVSRHSGTFGLNVDTKWTKDKQYVFGKKNTVASMEEKITLTHQTYAAGTRFAASAGAEMELNSVGPMELVSASAINSTALADWSATSEAMMSLNGMLAVNVHSMAGKVNVGARFGASVSTTLGDVSVSAVGGGVSIHSLSKISMTTEGEIFAKGMDITLTDGLGASISMSGGRLFLSGISVHINGKSLLSMSGGQLQTLSPLMSYLS